jgi:hypothetical protein
MEAAMSTSNQVPVDYSGAVYEQSRFKEKSTTMLWWWHDTENKPGCPVNATTRKRLPAVMKLKSAKGIEKEYHCPFPSEKGVFH